MYLAARLLNFGYAEEHDVSVGDVDLLGVFRFVTDEVISNLVAEKDEYHIRGHRI